MNIAIYQSFYEPNQKYFLSQKFIPFDNTANPIPHLREYLPWKFLQGKYDQSNDYWGLVSWRWVEKTSVNPSEFYDWIESNPGYDFYYLDPFLDVAAQYPNTWVQGNQWHQGMLEFANRLLPMIDIHERAENIILSAKEFATCNFFIGNKYFWNQWISFLENALNKCFFDDKLYDYMYRNTHDYNGQKITYFSFVVERLFSMYLKYKCDLKSLKFPIDHISYKQRFGAGYGQLRALYNSKNF